MKKIVVGFSKSRSPWKIGSKIIADVEARDFSHAYVKYNCILTDEVIISQASHGYVNEMNYDVFQVHNIVVHEYEIECQDSDFIEMLKFMRKNLGLPYSKMQIFFISLKKLFGFKINVYNRDKEFICSEWAARICKILKITVPEELDYFTPSDLNELLKNEPKAKRI